MVKGNMGRTERFLVETWGQGGTFFDCVRRGTFGSRRCRGYAAPCQRNLGLERPSSWTPNANRIGHVIGVCRDEERSVCPRVIPSYPNNYRG